MAASGGIDDSFSSTRSTSPAWFAFVNESSNNHEKERGSERPADSSVPGNLCF
jgi:hypothetical protein